MQTYRTLGKSDLRITPIGLGCWQFSKRNNMAGKFWPVLEDDVKALAVSLQILGKKPGEVIIATKWWPLFRTASNIAKTIDDRLKALEPFPIDLYQVHQPYGFSSEQEEMKAMAELVKAKKIRYVGVSNFSAQQMRNAWETLQKEGIDLVSNQVRYSLLDRKIESNGIMDTAKELGISIIAYSPLAQGLVTGKFHDNPDLLKNIGFRKYSASFKPGGLEKSKPVVELVKTLARKYKVTTSQVALNWLIHYHGETVVAIPGATKETHALENTGTLTFKLSPEDLSLLHEASKGFM